MAHPNSIGTVAALALAGLLGVCAPAASQAFGPGPPGIAVGSSMSGARIDGAPRPPGGRHIPNAELFGDEPEERRFGRAYDDSYLRPVIPRGGRDRSTKERAIEGRSDLNGIGAGVFAREGPGAIGRSSVTRPSSKGRAAIVFTKPQKAR